MSAVIGSPMVTYLPLTEAERDFQHWSSWLTQLLEVIDNDVSVMIHYTVICDLGWVLNATVTQCEVFMVQPQSWYSDKLLSLDMERRNLSVQAWSAAVVYPEGTRLTVPVSSPVLYPRYVKITNCLGINSRSTENIPTTLTQWWHGLPSTDFLAEGCLAPRQIWERCWRPGLEAARLLSAIND